MPVQWDIETVHRVKNEVRKNKSAILEFKISLYSKKLRADSEENQIRREWSTLGKHFKKVKGKKQRDADREIKVLEKNEIERQQRGHCVFKEENSTMKPNQYLRYKKKKKSWPDQRLKSTDWKIHNLKGKNLMDIL